MGALIILLTLVMVADSLALIGLILIQLPKKDTGGGLAFGGSTSDALFGAGSGNVLTKITKYAATGFFVTAVLLSVLQKNFHERNAVDFTRKLSQPAAPMGEPSTAPEAAPTPAPANPTPAPALNTNALLNFGVPTNAPAAPAGTNAAPK
jgi:preprotein translocase subunit SecG